MTTATARRVSTQAGWTDGEIARLRRRLTEELADKNPRETCRSVAKVADEFGVTAAEVRALLAMDERKLEAQAGRTARDASAAQAQVSPDIYRQERGALIERLEIGLHPHARWHDEREAVAPAVYRADNTPLAHTLAGACVWLRQRKSGRHDVSADLLWCLVMQEHCEAERQRVVCALVAAWLDMHAAVAKHAQTASGMEGVQRAARIIVEQCVSGVARQRKMPVHWQLWRKMQESGERMLWGLADTASRRAAAALR